MGYLVGNGKLQMITKLIECPYCGSDEFVIY